MSLKERFEKREKILLSRIARIKRLIASGYFDEAEADRLWLESFTKDKVGLDVCAGDVVTGDSIGVDCAYDVLGVDYLTTGDELNFAKHGEYDYVISNYFDAFPSPLKALNEWHRAVKIGGAVAFICCNADLYTNKLYGSLANTKRLSCFTEVTVKFYLERAGFKNITIVKSKQMLRCYGEKV